MTNKVVLVLCLMGLVTFYVFQKNIMGVFNSLSLQGYSLFVLKKSVRFIINDTLMIGVIYGLFNKKDYVKIAFLTQLFGLVFLLLPYLLLKYHVGGYNGPLVSFLHRLVLNPLLMLLLVPAFYYQEKLKKHS